MVRGHCKFMVLTSQAHSNTITPSYPNPNLTLTSLNTALQIANLIMYRGMYGQTDGVEILKVLFVYYFPENYSRRVCKSTNIKILA